MAFVIGRGSFTNGLFRPSVTPGAHISRPAEAPLFPWSQPAAARRDAPHAAVTLGEAAAGLGAAAGIGHRSGTVSRRARGRARSHIFARPFERSAASPRSSPGRGQRPFPHGDSCCGGEEGGAPPEGWAPKPG